MAWIADGSRHGDPVVEFDTAEQAVLYVSSITVERLMEDYGISRAEAVRSMTSYGSWVINGTEGYHDYVVYATAR